MRRAFLAEVEDCLTDPAINWSHAIFDARSISQEKCR